MSPGKYTPRDRGLSEIANSPAMSKAMVDIGKGMAGVAESAGDSKYTAEATTVRAGWNNETRQGARVKETERHWRDSRDAVLVRVVAAMTIRNRR